MKDKFSVIANKQGTPNKKATQTADKTVKSQPLYFKNVARYRCSQKNITKVIDEITFHATVKTEYLLAIANSINPIYHVKLEDYIYQVNPKTIESGFEIMEPIEFIRNDVVFSQNNDCKINRVLNLKEMQQKWYNFTKNTLPNLDIYNKIKIENNSVAQDIILKGNIEFSNPENLNKLLSQNLFYHVLLRANIGDKIKDYTWVQNAQLFPKQLLSIDVKPIISNNNGYITVHLIGALDPKKLNLENIEKLYDRIYKPLLHYKFSTFEYSYSIKYIIDEKSGLLMEAHVSLNEKIKNNFEAITHFDLKKVEL